MKRYTAKELIEEIKTADFVRGEVHLNAAETVTARIKKKSLIEKLEKKDQNDSDYFASVYIDDKGRKHIKFV
jgi:ppGpp synthetase/RelA/SpoT-type nucleotidyltranferase